MESEFAVVYFVLIHCVIFLMGMLIIKWHFAIKSYKLWVEHYKKAEALEKEVVERLLLEFHKEHALVIELNKEVEELHKLK